MRFDIKNPKLYYDFLSSLDKDEYNGLYLDKEAGGRGTISVYRAFNAVYHNPYGPSWMMIGADISNRYGCDSFDLGDGLFLNYSFDLYDAPLGYEAWLKHPEVVNASLSYIISEVLNEV